MLNFDSWLFISENGRFLEFDRKLNDCNRQYKNLRASAASTRSLERLLMMMISIECVDRRSSRARAFATLVCRRRLRAVSRLIVAGERTRRDGDRQKQTCARRRFAQRPITADLLEAAAAALRIRAHDTSFGERR